MGPAETVRLLEDRPGLADLLQRTTERGYALLSEIHDHADPLEAEPEWIEAVLRRLEDAGVEVIDDLVDAGAHTATDPTSADPMSASSDPIRHYLDGIGRTSLLSPEEEVDLAKRDRAAQAARTILTNGVAELTPRQRAMLRQIVGDGRRAHEHMVRANLRLVVSVARRFRGRGLELLDLIQEGNLGLMRAVEKFDHTKGYKFSTYATWWIRQALTRGLADKSRVLRLPVHVHETLGRVRWAELDLLQQLGREPTEAELAEVVDTPVERLRELRAAARDLLSLDAPIGEEGDSTRGHLVPDEDALDPEQAAAFLLTRDLVHEVLSGLSDRERGVVMLRFGLADGQCHTLEEVGAAYGVTRERIRQIEAKTLTKLRHPSCADRLRGLAATAGAMAASEVTGRS